MSEEGIRGRDDIMIQGDVGESMHLEEEAQREELHQHTREAENHQEERGEGEERIPAPSADSIT
jgi:hypothetical protein